MRVDIICLPFSLGDSLVAYIYLFARTLLVFAQCLIEDSLLFIGSIITIWLKAKSPEATSMKAKILGSMVTNQ